MSLCGHNYPQETFEQGVLPVASSKVTCFCLASSCFGNWLHAAITLWNSFALAFQLFCLPVSFSTIM